jgi:hypothetical protein
MSKTLIVNVKQCSSGFEGVIQLPNTAIKLANKSGCTLFATRGALTQAAQRFASVFGQKTEFAEPQKKAAKKNTISGNKVVASSKSSKSSKSNKNATCSKSNKNMPCVKNKVAASSKSKPSSK